MRITRVIFSDNGRKNDIERDQGRDHKIADAVGSSIQPDLAGGDERSQKKHIRRVQDIADHRVEKHWKSKTHPVFWLIPWHSVLDEVSLCPSQEPFACEGRGYETADGRQNQGLQPQAQPVEKQDQQQCNGWLNQLVHVYFPFNCP